MHDWGIVSLPVSFPARDCHDQRDFIGAIFSIGIFFE